MGSYVGDMREICLSGVRARARAGARARARASPNHPIAYTHPRVVAEGVWVQ